MDLLDLVATTERAFGITINIDRVIALFTQRTPPDATAGEWCEFVKSIYLHHDPHELMCVRCGYPRRGLPAESRCPECGHPRMDDEEIWKTLCQVLARSLGCPPERVRSEALLRRELDGSF